MAKLTSAVTRPVVSVGPGTYIDSKVLSDCVQAHNHAVAYWNPTILHIGGFRAAFGHGTDTEIIDARVYIPPIAQKLELYALVQRNSYTSASLIFDIGDDTTSATFVINSSNDTVVQSATIDTDDTGTGYKNITAYLSGVTGSGSILIRGLTLAVQPVFNHSSTPEPEG